MKRIHVHALLLASFAMLLVGAVALAEDAPAKADAAKPAKAATKHMMRYMIMVPHTQEECMKALDSFDTAKDLEKFDFGCKSGDHTAYAMVTAENEDAAKAMVPEDQRDKAKIVAVGKFTPAQLKKLHSMMETKK
jgi:hypothetical protein